MRRPRSSSLLRCRIALLQPAGIEAKFAMRPFAFSSRAKRDRAVRDREVIAKRIYLIDVDERGAPGEGSIAALTVRRGTAIW